ncbi:hypothetical protein SAMN06265337_2256 [Hymenobacter gelipurpurascens]|uniref:Uncharacterized protein n=1 Tax=Hymenobacter gelipurpurascens TaxID=89968 RepID=A0A212TR37_9BACT|nr:hypothetical protein [Hymenobacter gelipurpurascens]SNC68321.1 hypothetical protein SAMN06265337_2256 [Hymenobacter gelipurpurascens]
MMPTFQKDQGAQQVVIICICLLLSAALPLWGEGLFVDKTGNFSTSPALTVGLLMALLLRWRPARTILFILTILYLCVDYFAFSHAPDKIGFLLVAPLHLTAFLLLGFSRSVQQHFLRPASQEQVA